MCGQPPDAPRGEQGGLPEPAVAAGDAGELADLDLTFDPSVRGPYNYLLRRVWARFRVECGRIASGSGGALGRHSKGFADHGLRAVQRRVHPVLVDGSLQRRQREQLWRDLYFNLGSISEDLLNDGQLAFENGLPSPNQPAPVVESNWGLVADPTTFNVVNAFDNSTGEYSQQDVGLDGLNSQQEQAFFGDWLSSLQGQLEPDAYNAIVADPSADDFRYFRDPVAQANEEDVLERYRFFNGYEGNSNTAQPEGYPIASTTLPNTEDLEDLTLSAIESYFQYRSRTAGRSTESNIGRNYLSDVLVAEKTMPNGETRQVKWLQFVPIRDFEQRIGGIGDFRSIRFMRIFMKGWREPVTLRFARLELIRGECEVREPGRSAGNRAG